MTMMPTTISTASRSGKKAKKPAKKPRGTKSASTSKMSWRQQVARQRNLLMFTRQMHILLASGTPVVPALEGLERQTADPQWCEVTRSVRKLVQEGASISTAMGHYPEYFDKVYRSLIEAGESSGQMPEMLSRLVRVISKELETRNGVMGALLYPIILLSVVLVVLVITLTVVVPRFAKLFEAMNVPVPPTTQMTLFASMVLRSYWWAVLMAVAGIGVGLFFWLRSDHGRHTLHTVALRLPVIGRITRSFVTARIVRLIGTLVESRLPLIDVLVLVRGSCGNYHYANMVDRAIHAVQDGEPVSKAFDEPQLVSASVYEAFRSGEQSGRIGPSLITVADFLEEENDVIVRSLTKVLEPVILIVLGALVGLLAVSMFLPLFDLTAMAGEAN